MILIDKLIGLWNNRWMMPSSGHPRSSRWSWRPQRNSAMTRAGAGPQAAPQGWNRCFLGGTGCLRNMCESLWTDMNDMNIWVVHSFSISNVAWWNIFTLLAISEDVLVLVYMFHPAWDDEPSQLKYVQKWVIVACHCLHLLFLHIPSVVCWVCFLIFCWM
jgi:hypothetical protein